MWGSDRLSGGQLSGLRKRLRNGPCAVLTHSAAVDRKGRQTLEILSDLGVQPKLVFTPEHGLYGLAQAEEAVPSESASADDGRPELVSLYGTTEASLTPTSEQLAGLETLVIDLVDVGARYYTYVWTALQAARAARAAGVHTVVLDRPNPLSADPASIEGTPQEPGFLSFVGMVSVPVRHGLTLAELLVHSLTSDGEWSSENLGPDGALSVVSCRGWERLQLASAWGRPFIPPSPNMPTLETALVYPGGCLVEGTNLSEGRGTTLPFRVYGAPFLKEEPLAEALRDCHLPGVVVRPTQFRPSFDKHAGQVCRGIMLHVTDPRAFRPVQTGLSIIVHARAQAPEAFEFLTRAYEFETERLAFDLLTGSTRAREAIEEGASSNEVIDLACPVSSTWHEQAAHAQQLVESASA